MKIIAVTVCKREEKYTRKCVLSLINQTVPAFYVVVDDASTDMTPHIVREFEHVTLIRLKESGIRKAGVRLFAGFMKGVSSGGEQVPDWRYLVKVDADSILPSDYVSSVIERMEVDRKIGRASGVPLAKARFGYLKMKMDRNRATDGARAYKREWWDEIGSLYPMWSTATTTTSPEPSPSSYGERSMPSMCRLP